MTKNLSYFKETEKHPEIQENFWMFQMYTWFAKQVVYVLWDTAKEKFKEYMWIECDFCTFTNCEVQHWQEKIVPTEDSWYSLYAFNEYWDAELIPINWSHKKKAKKPFYKTFPWKHKDWYRIWLLISETDKKNFIQINKEQIEKLVLSLTSQ